MGTSMWARLLLTVIWVLIASLIWLVWGLIDSDVLRTLLPRSYTSENEAKVVAFQIALVVSLVKLAIMLGPLYLIWATRRRGADAAPESGQPAEESRVASLVEEFPTEVAGDKNSIAPSFISGTDKSAVLQIAEPLDVRRRARNWGYLVYVVAWVLGVLTMMSFGETFARASWTVATTYAPAAGVVGWIIARRFHLGRQTLKRVRH